MLGRQPRPRPAPMPTRDEELGKRDDDFRPKAKQSRLSQLLHPWQWRRSRLFVILALTVFIYLFVYNGPTELQPIDDRLNALRRAGKLLTPPRLHTTEDAPSDVSTSAEVPDNAKHYYDGAILFYRLASSLHSGAANSGRGAQNHNILFAAASLKSVSNLIPLACEMARYSRNSVHFAIMGRYEVPVYTILEINGVNSDACPMLCHDARPDLAEFSSDLRAESAVSGAMKHIYDALAPRAMVMDDSVFEDDFFTTAMRAKAAEVRGPLIEIPAGKHQDFMWMTRLDAASLASWNLPCIDILIQAPPDSAGGLIRLVKSLLTADYRGMSVPKITIELPANIEPFTQQFLEDVEWPPAQMRSSTQQKTISLRHRIPTQQLSSEQASVRMLESFYPNNLYDNHILVLSPRAELGPQFMHFLYYTLLEYKYSSYEYPQTDTLFGIALDVPTSYLNGSSAFNRPTLADMFNDEYRKMGELDKTTGVFFTYQAPSAGASLIFGDKWATLHDFLTRRLSISHAGKAQKTAKLVSETAPSWLEYALELMRARGWVMLHPPVNFATMHNELAQVPEEYIRPKKATNADVEDLKLANRLKDEPFLTSPNTPVFKKQPEQVVNRDYSPIHQMLPMDGDLPELPHLPFVSLTGEIDSDLRVEVLRDEYVPTFRQQIGGCDESIATKLRVQEEFTTGDLFCFPGQELQFQ